MFDARFSSGSSGRSFYGFWQRCAGDNHKTLLSVSLLFSAPLAPPKLRSVGGASLPAPPDSVGGQAGVSSVVNSSPSMSNPEIDDDCDDEVERPLRVLL